MAEFTVPTHLEFAAITRRTTQRMARQLLAVSARYDSRGARLMIVCNSPGRQIAQATRMSAIRRAGSAVKV
jgi:hypothetical protein